jgi:hypothetical protein
MSSALRPVGAGVSQAGSNLPGASRLDPTLAVDGEVHPPPKPKVSGLNLRAVYIVS